MTVTKSLAGSHVSWLQSSDLYFAWGTVWHFAFCALCSWGRVVFLSSASSLLTHFLQKTLNVSLSIVSCVVWHSDVRFLNKRNFPPCVLASFVTIYEKKNILADAYYIIYKCKKFIKSELSYGKELYNFIFWQRDVILVL